MATRSRIGILENGQVTSVYCHWDGHPENVGKILLENYSTLDKAKKLIAMGDISSLGTTPKETLFYSRGIGENTSPETHPKEKFPKTDQAYVYLFENWEWLFRKAGGKKWKSLKEYLAGN